MFSRGDVVECYDELLYVVTRVDGELLKLATLVEMHSNYQVELEPPSSRASLMLRAKVIGHVEL